MRISSLVIVTIGALAAWTFAASPAEAGKACNRLGLDSPRIKSNDLKARLNLDEDGRNARLRLRNADRANAVELDAGSGNLTNLFSNEENASNGLVKAWAQINSDGTIEACWRCNTDPAATRRIGDGSYHVDFTPLATDITGRPRSATISGADSTTLDGVVRVKDPFGDASAVLVNTNDMAGASEDRTFTLIIY